MRPILGAVCAAAMVWACSARPAEAARAVLVQVYRNGKPILSGLAYDVGRRLPLTHYMGTTFDAESGYRVTPDAGDPLRATIAGPVHIVASAPGTEAVFTLDLPQLPLVRAKVRDTEWWVGRSVIRALTPPPSNKSSDPSYGLPTHPLALGGLLAALIGVLVLVVIRRRSGGSAAH